MADPCSDAEMGDADDLDLDTLVMMLDGEVTEEPECQASTNPDPSIAEELGLVLSDEEEEEAASQPPTSSSSFSSFSAAFSKTKPSNKQTKENNDAEVVDPLESELREMEARVKLLQESLAKKKRLQGKTATRFTKLTTTSGTEKKTTSRVLSAREEAKLHKRLKRGSELHSGETDSEDEEDNRNPMEQRYNTDGQDIKRRIAHESQSKRIDRVGQDINRRIAQESQSKKIERVDKAPTINGSATEKTGWKTTDRALVNLARAGSTSSQDTDKNVTLDAYSGIRIVNPLVSQEAMRERMETRKMVRLSTITLHLRNGEIEGDWATIGVLVSKSNPKVSQKGSQYSIWKLSDLSDCTKTAALFLFGGSHKSLWKHSIGTVFGILNPNILKEKRSEGFSDIISLSIFEPQRVMVMGSSKDLGWCKGTTKMNEPCRQFVNKSSCEFCVYHIQREYQKSSSKRSDLQSTFSRVDPKRRLQERVLGKDQVFYGGQLYTSPAVKPPPKQPKANRAKDLATLNSLKIKMKAEELKAKDIAAIPIPKHLSEGEASAVKDVVQTNEFLGEKLLAPSPGARNLLKHMVKEDTKKKVESGAIRSVSAKELLTMTHQSMVAMRKQQQENIKRKSGGHPSPSSVSQPSAPQKSGGRPSLSSLSRPLAPQLARGVQPGGEVNLDIFSPPSARQLDPAKAKALALVQRKGGIQAADPNAVRNKEKAVLPEFKNKIQKRLNTDDDDGVDSAVKKSRLSEDMKNGTLRNSLGALNTNSDKFKDMMEKKSRHSNLVDVVENEAMEKYYQGLEKKEMMEEKLSSIMEITITAHVCFKCKYMSERVSELCKEENHDLKTIKAKKRFFECRNCKQRTSALDKLPRKSCGNCDHNSWCRVPMGKIKKGPKLDSEILSLRGDELKHYSGSSAQIYLHV